VINFTDAKKGDVDDNDGLMRRRYGQNPLGVDISDCLSFAPSLAFKNLQGETEEKVKYYGCLCWSEQEISSQEELVARLGSFPLQLKQKTPIRVLHRRSNAIRLRHVLTLSAKLIDKHHFRLNLSTDAGTYVKEFAHGDLGRTVPSVSSLLGCKTDILELDCEGIAVV
jgi:tRNA pseudouridine(54/55) synthase